MVTTPDATERPPAARPHDVFISYSHRDRDVADVVYRTLQQSGLRCWMAPHALVGGQDWPAAIAAAIPSCHAMVLVLSRHANDSKQVYREVTLAVDGNVSIIPFRIEDVAPTGNLAYFLSVAHRIDAFVPGPEAHLAALERAVRGVLPARPAPVAPAAAFGSFVPPAAPANLGRLVPKMCDRLAQVNAFDAFMRTNHRERPGGPQIFVVQGEEGQSHESLVERLVGTTVSLFAEEVGGVERGAVVRLRVPWPEADDFESGRRDLPVSLFREADPRYLGDDLTAARLAERLAGRLSSVVVVQHDVRMQYWRGFTPKLLAWYVDEFWGAPGAVRADQQVLVFLKLIYRDAPPRTSLLQSLLRVGAPRVDKQRVQRELEAVLRAADRRCACMIFKELAPVTKDDVMNWFDKHGIYESQRKREDLAARLFHGAEVRRMAEVEEALEEFHRAYVNERTLLAGGIA